MKESEILALDRGDFILHKRYSICKVIQVVKGYGGKVLGVRIRPIEDKHVLAMVKNEGYLRTGDYCEVSLSNIQAEDY